MLERFHGTILALLGAFFFSLFAIFNKITNFVTRSEQMSVYFLIQMILMTILARGKQELLFGPKEFRFKLIQRGLYGTFAFISFSFSLQYIDPSNTEVIQRPPATSICN